MVKRGYIFYIEDMLVSMNRIEEYIEGLEFIQFKQNYLIVDAVIRNLEIIGEASKNIPEEIKKTHTIIPWEKMYGLRNRISHEYFGLDYEIIWEIIKRQLPLNRADLELVLIQEKSNT